MALERKPWQVCLCGGTCVQICLYVSVLVVGVDKCWMQGAYTQVYKCMNFHMMFAHYKLPSPTPPIPNRLTAIQLPTQSLYNPVEVSSGLFNSFRLLQPNKKGGGGGGRAANTSAGTKRRPSLQAQHVSLTCSLRNTLTGVQSKDFQFVRNCATLNFAQKLTN